MHWSATKFFKYLTENNRLAQQHEFRFCQISGLEGFESALQNVSALNMVCISDISDGFIELNNSPKTRSVKTVFLSMRHPVDNLQARQKCMDTMRELFRQFMSILIREKIRLEEHFIYLDPRISFTEIDRYFFNGAACCYFQIAIDHATDLRYSESEWIERDNQAFSTHFATAFHLPAKAFNNI